MADLSRFIEAQEYTYPAALAEIKGGRKQSHWMWFIFPQMRGLGRSETAEYYGIESYSEARAYLDHPVLGKNLIEISAALLPLAETDARVVFGSPDDMKLRSCMTLFHNVDPDNPVFADVLEKFFQGKEDARTLRLLGIL